MMDLLMVGILILSLALIFLLVKWCKGQTDDTQ